MERGAKSEACHGGLASPNVASPPFPSLNPPLSRALSLSPSPPQLGFIDYIVHPLYKLAGSAQIVDLSEPLEQLNANRSRWEASAAADAAASAAAAAAAEPSGADAT